jgi:NAD(P)-dependent dehydrogenase (short-subunit alcohol dehydrogenase family)
MPQRRAGRIVNVSSILGRFALPGSGVYAASKFALEAASDALRMELAPFGVRVVLVEPGVIDTPLYRRAAASLPDEQALQPYQSTWPGGFGFPSGCCGPPRRWTGSPPPWLGRRWRPALAHATDLGCETG